MYQLKFTTAFKKSYKRMKKRGLTISLLDSVIDTLRQGQLLDTKYRDHMLKGEFAGFHECHIQPDWLLMRYDTPAMDCLTVPSMLRYDKITAAAQGEAPIPSKGVCGEMTDYSLLVKQMQGFLATEPYFVSALANASALLWEALRDINWAGYYIVRQDILTLGPFQGKTACIHIAKGKGVCGTAWAADKTLVVPDVHEFAGHIACDSASRSEIVIPLHRDGAVVAVLDIDSPRTDRFDETDRIGLEAFAAMLEDRIAWE